jgi:hypothetical protein
MNARAVVFAVFLISLLVLGASRVLRTPQAVIAGGEERRASDSCDGPLLMLFVRT